MSADLDNRFDYHRPDEAKADTHQQVRNACKALAETLDELVPAGREKSLVITNLEQAMFWANAAIARS